MRVHMRGWAHLKMILHTKTLQVAIKTGYHEVIIQALYTSNGKKSHLFPLKKLADEAEAVQYPFCIKKGQAKYNEIRIWLLSDNRAVFPYSLQKVLIITWNEYVWNVILYRQPTI